MSKYHYNNKLFDFPNKITYYMLGAYIADGCVDSIHQNRITISSKDEDWLISIAKQISSNSLPRKLKNSNCFVFYINSKKIVDWFVANQCTPRKSLTIKMPIISEQYFPHFMRGLFDGDGCITIVKERSGITHLLRINISGGSRPFFEAIKIILCKFDINSSIQTITHKQESIMGRPTKDYNDSYRLIINGKNAVKFCKYIYNNDNLHLERKYQTYLKYVEIRKCEAQTCTIREAFTDSQHILNLLKTRTYKEVGKMFGVSQTTVIGRLKKAGLYEKSKQIRRSF